MGLGLAWRRMMRLEAPRRRLAAEAMLGLLAARVALQVVPFRRLAAGLGEALPAGEAGARLAAQPTPAQADEMAAEVRWAVRAAAAHAPFRAVCLPQALTAKRMLQRRGVPSALHFGVTTGAGDHAALEAHAWLQAAGVEVTGYPIARRFTEIACFV